MMIYNVEFSKLSCDNSISMNASVGTRSVMRANVVKFATSSAVRWGAVLSHNCRTDTSMSFD